MKTVAEEEMRASRGFADGGCRWSLETQGGARRLACLWATFGHPFGVLFGGCAGGYKRGMPIGDWRAAIGRVN